MDMASSIQKITENIILKTYKKYKERIWFEKFMYGWRSSIKLCSEWQNFK